MKVNDNNHSQHSQREDEEKKEEEELDVSAMLRDEIQQIESEKAGQEMQQEDVEMRVEGESKLEESKSDP